MPTFASCVAPNRTHGPPLAFPSCNPTNQSSPSIWIGSPDANGAAANFTGKVKLKVLRSPGGPSDVEITGSIVDVRCKAGTTACGTANVADGADYTGELRLVLDLRITDRGGGDGSATLVNFDVRADTTCAAPPPQRARRAC